MLLALFMTVMLCGCGSGTPAPVSCADIQDPVGAPVDMAFDADGGLWLVYGLGEPHGALRPSSRMASARRISAAAPARTWWWTGRVPPG